MNHTGIKCVLLNICFSLIQSFLSAQTKSTQQLKDTGFQVVYQDAPKEMTTLAFDGEDYSLAGWGMSIRRDYSPYLLKWYMPTLMLVAISGISFFIPAEIVAGRMALLITIFLMLVNVSNAADSNLSTSVGLTGLDIWLRACMAFVAAGQSLLESHIL